MKLSEAIREGAKLRPRCQGVYFDFVADGAGRVVVGSCAMGAAYEAVGGVIPSPFTLNDKALDDNIAETLAGTFHLEGGSALWWSIVHYHDRPMAGVDARVQTADWLETQGY